MPGTQIATFAAGCFWCYEAVYQRVKGVIKVTSGYAGGEKANPSYAEVTSGDTGHAEAVQIEFDPNVISYLQLLEIFWHVHNPTTLNRQGNDVGTQYRSVIFYHNEAQHQAALSSKQTIAASLYDQPIVTEIVPFTNFYAAEDYHRDYYNQNPDQAYCQVVISPKLQKFRQEFAGLLNPA